MRLRGHKQRKLNDHVYLFLSFVASGPDYQAEFKFVNIWLARWAGMVNQIVQCDWLPKQARAILCARDYCRVPLENLSKSQTINPILTKFFGQDGWTLASFMDCDSVLVHKRAKKELQWPISSHLDQKSLVNKPCISKMAYWQIIMQISLGLKNGKVGL